VVGVVVGIMVVWSLKSFSAKTKSPPQD